MSGPVARIALTREEAAEALGLSLSSFIRHVQSEVPVIRRGACRLYSVRGLEEWADRNGERVMS